MPAASVLMLLAGWTVLAPAWFWTLSVLGILLVPPLMASILELLAKPAEAPWRRHLAAASRSAARTLALAGFNLACLPHEAYYSLDAIARTAARMLVTRSRLLEWTASSEMDRGGGRSELAATIGSMWFGPVLAIATAIYLAVSRPAALAVAGPILALWLASPAIAWWLGRPRERREARLTAAETGFLRMMARRTWAFFDRFVGPEDHWLPPDNYQEHPVAVLAHRTSPTNMGFALLANLAAYDFGYVPAGRLVERTAHTLRTMQALERYRGHFYNWYDTRTLKPLSPLYVSSVDSGNLAGHLLTLRPGLLALGDAAILAPRWLEGLRDTAGLLDDERVGKALQSALQSPPATPAAARAFVEELAARAADAAAGAGNEAQEWARALARQCGRPARGARASLPGRGCPGRRDPDVARTGPRRRRRRAPCPGEDRRDRAPGGVVRRARRDVVRLPVRSPSASSSPSATTSARSGATRATTTCSPRRRAPRASWRSPRASCRRTTGSPSVAC